MQETAHTQWWSCFQGRAGWWIFFVALALRVGWVLTLDNALTWADERDFVGIGMGMTEGKGYVSDSFRAAPGMPVYLSLVFRVFGESYLAARLGQCVLGALTCVLLWRLGVMLAGELAGVLAGVVLALYPPFVYLAGVFYVECLLTFLLTLSVYLVVRTARPGEKWWMGLLAGVALGMTTLTRSTFVLFVPCVMLAWLCGMQAGGRRRVLACVVFCVGMAAVVAPWAWRNQRVFGRFVLVNTGFYSALWRGNSELTTGAATERDLFWRTPLWSERANQLPVEQREALNEKYARIDREYRVKEAELGDAIMAYDAVVKPVAMELVRTNPGRTARLFVRKVGVLYSAFSPTTSSNAYTTGKVKQIAVLTFYPILLLGLAGIWLCRARWREWLPVGLLIGVVTGAHGLLIAATRYRLPIDVCWVLLAAAAVGCLTRRWTHGISEGAE